MNRIGHWVLLGTLVLCGCEKKKPPPKASAPVTQAPRAATPVPAPVEEPAPAAPAPSARPVAPSTPGLPPVAISPEMDKLGISMLSVSTAKADLMERNAHDCPKLAAELNAFATQNKELVLRHNAEYLAMPDEQKIAWTQAHLPELQTTLEKMENGLVTCGKDAEVLKAIYSLPHQTP